RTPTRARIAGEEEVAHRSVEHDAVALARGDEHEVGDVPAQVALGDEEPLRREREGIDALEAAVAGALDVARLVDYQLPAARLAREARGVPEGVRAAQLDDPHDRIARRVEHDQAA